MAAQRRASTCALAAVVLLTRIAPLDAGYLLSGSGDYSQGCFPLTVGSYTKDMSLTSGSYSCNSARCPPCFIFNTDAGPVQLQLDNCHKDSMTSFSGVDVLTKIIFTNIGANGASVTDGTHTYMVPREGERGATMECTCINNGVGSGVMSCGSTITPVSTTGELGVDYQESDNCLKTSSDQTLNYANSECDFKRCPYCWQLDTSGGTVTLTITNCHYFFGIDVSSSAGAMTYLRFTNSGSNNGYVTDGTKVYTLAPYGFGGSTATCYCVAGALSCSADTVRASGDSTGEARFPEALSVTSYSKFGNYIRLHTYRFDFGNDDQTYAQYNEGTGIQWYVAPSPTPSPGVRSVSMTAGGGTLHGSWYVDAALITSDRRMKKDIEPLNGSLRRIWQTVARKRAQAKPAASQEAPAADEDTAQWLLDLLQPVSYKMKHDAKGSLRFGFIADEIGEVFPEMIQRSDDSAKTQRVHMLDLIALLVASVQQQGASLRQLGSQRQEFVQSRQSMEARLARLELQVDHLSKQAVDARLARLEQMVSHLSEQLRDCCAAAQTRDVIGV